MRSEYETYHGLAPCQCHQWRPQAPYCSCGQDTVTCQGCGKLVCGSLAVWRTDLTKNDHAGNIGPCCFARFGLGHQGTTNQKETIQ